MTSPATIRHLIFVALHIALMAVFALSPLTACAADEQQAAASDKVYIIGPEDVLKITVWDHDDLTKSVTVDLDGYINYKFVGRVRVEGLSMNALAKKLETMLADGYIREPHVTVQVESYRSRKLFIIGEVHKPGTYYLTRRMTIVEAISMAQGPTAAADREITIVRKSDDGSSSNLLVNLQRALEGDTSQDIEVMPGDAIYISKAKTFFIMGEVHKPDQYKLEKDTTFRKALSIAGGHTEKAALGRIKVIRLVNGEKVEKEVELEEMVQPFDTIVVPQSYF